MEKRHDAARSADASTASERRRFRRHVARLTARLHFANGLALDCVVRDYSSGGFLVQIPNGGGGMVNPSRVGEKVRLDPRMRLNDSERVVRFPAVIAWAGEDSLGLALTSPVEAVVAVMQRHEESLRKATLTLNGGEPAIDPRMLDVIRNETQSSLRFIARRVLDGMERQLFLHSREVISEAQRGSLIIALEALQGPQLEPELMHAFEHLAFARPEEVTRADNDSELGEMSLVDPDDFERWLESSRIAQRLEGEFEKGLGNIARRLTGDSEGISATVAIPYEPRHFTGAVKDLVRRLGFIGVARNASLEGARWALSGVLEEFYETIEKALDAAGVAPASVSKPRALRMPGRDVAAAAAVSGPPGAQASPHAGRAMLERLLADLDEDALRSLASGDVEERMRQARELLGLVTSMPDLPQSMAGWLQSLENTVARQAIINPSFFQDRQNPTRELVDSLWHLQKLRASHACDGVNDAVAAKVQGLLGQLDTMDSPEDTIRDVTDKIKQLVNRESLLYQRSVERVAQASEGRDRMRLARNTVIKELNRRYAGHAVPAVALELLDVGWIARLELEWLKNGDSESYRLSLALFDGIVARLGGEPHAADCEPLDDQACVLGVQGQLGETSFDPFRLHAVENRLRAELSTPVDQISRTTMQPLQGDNLETSADDPPAGVTQKAWRRALGRCETLVVGDRIRTRDDAGEQTDLAIAWIRSDGERFTLVDQRGTRHGDIHLADLAEGICIGRCQLSRQDARAASERAVDAMLQNMQERASLHMSHDSLTGLPNRQQFNHSLAELVMHGDAESSLLMLIDVDQFRSINEVHGYTVGDELLIAMARLLEGSAGDAGLSHLGSDRFAMLLGISGISDAQQFAATIRDAVSTMPFEQGGRQLKLSASVAAVRCADVSDGVDALLQAAEASLVAAKEGSGVCVYSADDPGLARQAESAQWLARVDEALDTGWLKLRCQPIVPVRKEIGLATHFEVLLGVHTAAHGDLRIAEFINAAERYNRMRAVDRWVTRTVMEWINANPEAMSRVGNLSVNLSGQTASDPTFVDFVRQLLQRYAITPSWLSFEVTETAAVAELSRAAGIIGELKALGCKIALDDFGSGQASYSYLKELPVDWLKIDGVFVKSIAANREDYAVVKSINEIAHFLGKQTIAEYVVDQPTLQRIGEIGVDYGQGFGISRPFPMSELLQRI